MVVVFRAQDASRALVLVKTRNPGPETRLRPWWWCEKERKRIQGSKAYLEPWYSTVKNK